MKVLFLDIDGVLNSRRTAVAFGSYPHKLAHLERFDHAALGLVRRLCEAGVSVVLSSSWREEYQHSEIGRALDLPIIGGTPVLSGSRGSEIAAWLVEHEDVRTWAIVDDDPDMLEEQRGCFVQTDPDNGLLWGDYVALCAILDVETVPKAGRDRHWRAGTPVKVTAAQGSSLQSGS
ncbi:HAD domain-containing protein [Candidatus Skiveiella danica]|jgi:hypothetical protein|uniref:HAD domain-containing protein n=1 Tax=Candidatus Skiveiella danica TaxID=3386177 RepID=UPI0009D16A8A|nr:MAG: hypothetical protein BWX79_00307 [Alphaproteobacteria bacterium ADurb.Bin100]